VSAFLLETEMFFATIYKSLQRLWSDITQIY
jgi:hypothetical protein